MGLSRRGFIGVTAAIPFDVWFRTAADAATVFTRYEARSTQGKAMLQDYRTAVAKMKTQTAQTDPTGWQFQWYTHQTPSNKAQAIARVYKSDPKYKSLAGEMWSTCEAHTNDADENFFLPWHRMFVYFFERIVRKASGNPAFTLPYWNYSAAGQFHGAIPPEFTVKASSLYVPNRNSGVNAGQAIDQSAPGALDLEALSQTAYQAADPVPGFCSDLDNNLHGNVHGLVGTVTNMGTVPTAGQDPIFWLHHCNIDRLWASWNTNGGKNPADSSFLKRTFVFADENNNRVVGTVEKFLDITGLGYTYDALEPAPASFHPAPILTTSTGGALSVPPPTDTSAHIALGSAPVTVALTATSAQGNALSFPSRIASLTSQRVYLVIRGLQTNAQPGVLYDIYLNLPASATGEARRPFRVGSLNFFSVMTQEGGMPGMSRFLSFDVTSVLKAQAASGTIQGKPQVTIVPTGQPDAQAKPVIGSISLAQR